MKTVLLLTDFSDNSITAIRYSINFFANQDCKFVLMHAYMSPNAGASMLVSINDILHKEAVSGLKEIKENLLTEFPELENKLVTEAVYGDIALAVKVIMNDYDIHYIVMGTKGISNLEEMLVGSSVSHIIKSVSVPVLAVPNKLKFEIPKKIGLAIDSEEKYKDSVFTETSTVAESFNAKLDLFTIDTGENKLSNGVFEGYKRALNGSNYTLNIVQKDNIAEGIQEYVSEADIDVLAMIAKKYSFLSRIFHRSMTKNMARMTTIPLLVFYEQNA